MPIPIDTSIEDWIKEIEENVRKNKTTTSNFVATERVTEDKSVHRTQSELNMMPKENAI